MAYRNYRRKRSMAGEMLSNTSYVANRLSWKGSAILGVILFVIFYWLLPAWLNAPLNSLQGNMYHPITEAAFAKRIHWLGIALGLICAFFAIRNYLTFQHLDSSGERNVSFISRLLARWID